MMIKKILFNFVIVLLFFLPFCTRLNYDITPNKSALYHSLKLKVNVRNLETKQKQGFRILFKYNNEGDKLIFLSPLNQLYGLLFVKNEDAVLINTKRENYWEGKFNLLLDEMWGLDFNYFEFKQLILKGVLPKEKIKEQDIKIIIERSKDSSDNKEPQNLIIRSGVLQLKIKISERRTDNGLLSLLYKLKGMKKAFSVQELLEGENE